MEPGNFEGPPAQESPVLAVATGRNPCDYYAGPTPSRVFPRGVTFGCGGASILFLLVLFLGGGYLAGGGFAQLMDVLVGMTMGEMRGLYSSEVTPQQKESLEKEVESLRESVRSGKLNAARLQPFMQELQKSIVDSKVTPDEVNALTAAARDAAKPPARRGEH